MVFFSLCHGFPQPPHYSTNHSTQSNPSDLSSAFLCLQAKFEHKNPKPQHWTAGLSEELGIATGSLNPQESFDHCPFFMVKPFRIPALARGHTANSQQGRKLSDLKKSILMCGLSKKKSGMVSLPQIHRQFAIKNLKSYERSH